MKLFTGGRKKIIGPFELNCRPLGTSGNKFKTSTGFVDTAGRGKKNQSFPYSSLTTDCGNKQSVFCQHMLPSLFCSSIKLGQVILHQILLIFVNVDTRITS